jgi:L-amino acid N-acyltransferase YncA
VLIAGIDGSNAASIRLHQRAGFVEVARMPEVGCKFGRWLDLVFMQRALEGAARPNQLCEVSVPLQLR